MSATAMFGYPDWQRLTNWDGPVIWALPATPSVGTITSPVLQVSRYACLGGIVSLTAGKATVTFTWYADQATTVQIGQRVLRLDVAGSFNAQLRLPNMGGWCVITFTAFGGAAYTAQAQIMPTNRVHPMELIPIDTMQLGLNSSTLNSNQVTTTTYPYLFSGPAHWWCNSSVASTFYQLKYLNSGGTYSVMEQVFPAATVDTRLDIVLPATSVQVQVGNLNAAAATMQFWIVPSMTGG